jgi:hypothetical protein
MNVRDHGRWSVCLQRYVALCVLPETCREEPYMNVFRARAAFISTEISGFESVCTSAFCPFCGIRFLCQLLCLATWPTYAGCTAYRPSLKVKNYDGSALILPLATCTSQTQTVVPHSAKAPRRRHPPPGSFRKLIVSGHTSLSRISRSASINRNDIDSFRSEYLTLRHTTCSGPLTTLVRTSIKQS